MAWRRYTKQSRNKTGEIEGALLPLKDTYPTCRFLGAIVAGEYTDGGKRQLESHGIVVFHIPFDQFARCFRKQGVELSYPESATSEQKLAPIRQWEALSPRKVVALRSCIEKAITHGYSAFRNSLQEALLRRVESIRVFPLYGTEHVFSSVREAMKALHQFEEAEVHEHPLVKFELQLRFSNGDKVDAAFHAKEAVLDFLAKFA